MRIEYFGKMQQLSLVAFGVLTCFCLRLEATNFSLDTQSFDNLCRFEGVCLNCSDGGCEDMCNFYDNTCCSKKTSPYVALDKWQYECVRKFPDMYDLHLDCRGSFDGVYGVYMVTKCSKVWEDNFIKAKCEETFEDDLLSNIPVYDNSHDIVTYRNMYCAFCNNLNLRQLKFWKFDLMCNDEFEQANESDNFMDGSDYKTGFKYGSDYDTGFMYGNCFIRLLYNTHRMCAMDIIETCSNDKRVHSSLKEKCERGLTQNVYVWKKERMFNVYKNEFCAKCNFEIGALQCWAFQAFSCWPQALPPYTRVKAMVKLDLFGQKNKVSLKLFNVTCGVGVLYDPFINNCMNITCLFSKNICISGKCYLVEVEMSDVLIQNDSSLHFFHFGYNIRYGRYFVNHSIVHVCLNEKQFSEYATIQQTTPQNAVTSTRTDIMKPTSITENTSTVFANGSTSELSRDSSLLVLCLLFLSRHMRYGVVKH